MIKYKFENKISFLIKLFLLLLISFGSFADDTKISSNLIVLGENNAPIKIKIFSSHTCPHCANFHMKVIPKIKEKYIEAGKVQLIFIDFPLDQAALNASILLHCLNEKKQMLFLDTIYEKQSKWMNGSDINEINLNLKKIVKSLGITSAQFDKCLKNEIITDKILNDRINGHKKYSINSTPTIIINEKKLDGSANFKNIEKIIEKLIEKLI
jgi:protein-disulfide isomerase